MPINTTKNTKEIYSGVDEDLKLRINNRYNISSKPPLPSNPKLDRMQNEKEAKDEIYASMVESFDAYLPVYFDTLENARAAVATLGFDRILKVLSAGH